MKVYTKTGDKGTTSLFGGTRVPKDHARIESYGTVDELNSYIGLIRDQEINTSYKAILIEVQDRLFTVGAILATPPEKEVKKNGELRLQNLGIVPTDIELLENEIDQMEESLPPMTHFVLPGGHTTVSYCHIARCVCRRAERLAVHLSHNEPVPEIAITYLNRLSDYLFVLARKLSHDLQAEEVKWIPRK
ncbi:cob(I)yrinic acid a,c-diamide adenosyltransferase [Flavobacterium sp. F-328]|jgi:cob(I)alamin adenosyltransferase|uniref:Corrinoid adenosyltransferase n=2 Tax=Flavobacterium TaxID=237 RepID=A0ABR7JFF7_9FLAO|nr:MULTISPECIES: cob(I)yrinic acid a,c-diamide adenosyltransferase [Flavobacterium]MBC5863197.1 cob(I)yrinic acid a,c-diamide adenosyltransferase [Flavobacterium turcicum]MBQ0908166.1 cob(I)yrinic acid a,c-diamide adenosyltransferase [Flavobacterium erciyesense]NHL01929.1 cob(I)yrinic acid a,c-diamide adenosyltransferase [Flavobacterium turcicum]